MTPLFGASYLLTDQPELHEDAKCEVDESENDNTKPVTPWPTEAELTA